MLSIPHLIIIFIVALVVFGPEKFRNWRATSARSWPNSSAPRATCARPLRATCAIWSAKPTSAALAQTAATSPAAAARADSRSVPRRQVPCHSPPHIGSIRQESAVRFVCYSGELYRRHARIRRAQHEPIDPIASTRQTPKPSPSPETRDRWRHPPSLSAHRASVAEEEAGGRMSFFEHLVELRKRLVNSLIGIGAGMVVGLLVSKRFIDFIVQPMQNALRANHLDDKLYYTSPAGYISLVINLGMYLGIVIAMPWVLYQVWLFVAPGSTSTSAAPRPASSFPRCFCFCADRLRLFHYAAADAEFPDRLCDDGPVSR